MPKALLHQKLHNDNAENGYTLSKASMRLIVWLGLHMQTRQVLAILQTFIGELKYSTTKIKLNIKINYYTFEFMDDQSNLHRMLQLTRKISFGCLN